MSLATSNRDGGRTNEAGHLRGVTKGFVGQVLQGLNVSQRGAGANMSVDIAIGDAIIQRSDGSYGHPAWNDAVLNQVIAAADGSNPRRDIIVMYIDYNQAPSTGVANNTNGVVKVMSVSGTAAGSPVDPSNATIQSAVGSGNPFVKLARVRVAAGATSISNSVIDDLRVMATINQQGGWISESLYNWVYASSTSFTIAGVDLRSQFPVGTKIALYQSGSIKYFNVKSTSFSTNTTVNISGGGSYTLANVPIDKPAFSYDLSPVGYNLGSVTSQDTNFDVGYSIKNYANGTANYSRNSTTLATVDATNLKATLDVKKGRLIRVDLVLTGVWNSNTGYAVRTDIGLDSVSTLSSSGTQSISPAGFTGNWTPDGNSRAMWTGTFFFTNIPPGVHDFLLLWATSNALATSYLGQYATQTIIVTEVL